MTKEKWVSVVTEVATRTTKLNREAMKGPLLSVESWPEVKRNFLTYIKEIDEATEVFEMENKR